MKIEAFEIKDGVVSGPKTYMEESGFDTLKEIEAGRNAVANHAFLTNYQLYMAVLVALQTDYAAWKGMKRTAKELGLA